MLTVEEATDLANSYFDRRKRFPEEEDHVSFFVVVFNFGDHLTPVRCTKGEWKGLKKDLPKREGLPLCPNGHPLLESRNQVRLGLIPAE